GCDFPAGDDIAGLNELHFIERDARDNLRLEPRTERPPGRHVYHRAHRLTIHTEGQQRSVRHKVTPLAQTLDPSVPGCRRTHLHVLTRSSGDIVYAAPIGEDVRTGTQRCTEAAVQEPVPQLVRSFSQGQDIDRIHRPQCLADGHLLSAEICVKHPDSDSSSGAHNSPGPLASSPPEPPSYSVENRTEN